MLVLAAALILPLLIDRGASGLGTERVSSRTNCLREGTAAGGEIRPETATSTLK